MVDLSAGPEVIREVGLVIFDKDGTLIELYHYWSRMVRLRARLICEALGLDVPQAQALVLAMGVDLQAGRLRPEGPVGLKKREIVIQAAVDCLAGAGFEGTREICAAAFDRADEISCRDLGAFVQPIPGAVDLLESLHAAGCRMALATVDRSERARLAMEFMGMTGRLDLIVGSERVVSPKPAPDMLHFILRTLGIDRSRAIMVGDALTDIHMGQAAGLKACVGVLTGFATQEQMRAITPFVIRDVSELAVL